MRIFLSAAAFVMVAAAAFGASGVLEKDEAIEFYPSAGIILPDGSIRAQISGRVYETEASADAEKLRSAIAAGTLLTEKESESSLFRKRLGRFFPDNEYGRIVRIRIADSVYELSSTGITGYFSGELTVPSGDKNGRKSSPITYYAVLPEADSRVFSGTILPVPDNGVSVISDIDDTIKISDVAHKGELFKNTFLREYRAVPGMPEIYGIWAGKGAVFHYVSGSPRQMYSLLSEFCTAAGYPAAEFIFKNANLLDGSFMSFVTADQVAFKTGAIAGIFSRFPKRRFILVGDSGEKDPEVYASIAEKYKGQVLAVCIRDVSLPGETAKRVALLNNGKTRWVVFSDPAVLASLLP